MSGRVSLSQQPTQNQPVSIVWISNKPNKIVCSIFNCWRMCALLSRRSNNRAWKGEVRMIDANRVSPSKQFHWFSVCRSKECLLKTLFTRFSNSSVRLLLYHLWLFFKRLKRNISTTISSASSKSLVHIHFHGLIVGLN